MSNLNPLYLLKEGATEAAIGASAGGVTMLFTEWLLHWIKELKTAAIQSNSPQELKEWYDKNIVDDDAIYWTRKGYLKTDYFSRAINMMAQNNDPNYKQKVIRRCNKYLLLNRVAGGLFTGYMAASGAMM